MSFTPDGLRAVLRSQGGRDWCLAYSGGLDSTVLLHALVALRPACGADLRAVHVDHGWHPGSAQWAEHCIATAAALGVECSALRAAPAPDHPDGPEAAARDARHALFRDHLAPGETLLTAQHADDQAETVLLALLRGSGPDGLAAMPQCAVLGGNTLLRPLLGFTRAELEAWARQENLAWIEDPSNVDPRYARGYLRAHVLPALRERWPGHAGNFARSAELAAEASALLDELAQSDLGDAGGGPLPLALLENLPPARGRNLLRGWLRRAGLPPPPYPRLVEAHRQLLDAGADRNPAVAWTGGVLRRFQGRVHAHPPLEAVPESWSVGWDGQTPLELPAGLGTLELKTGDHGLDVEKLVQARLTVRFRAGGEKLRPAGQAHHVPLKHLLQRSDIPPWERGRIPLLYADDALVAVGDRWIAHEWSAAPGGAALALVHHRKS